MGIDGMGRWWSGRWWWCGRGGGREEGGWGEVAVVAESVRLSQSLGRKGREWVVVVMLCT